MRAQGVVVELEPLGHALAEILHEHVALRGEPVDDLTRFGTLQIERDTLLVTIVRLEVEVAPAAPGGPSGDRDDSAPRIATLAFLYLDHLGAEIGEHRGRHRSLLPNGPIQYPDSFERRVHGALYTTTGREA